MQFIAPATAWQQQCAAQKISAILTLRRFTFPQLCSMQRPIRMDSEWCYTILIQTRWVSALGTAVDYLGYVLCPILPALLFAPAYHM